MYTYSLKRFLATLAVLIIVTLILNIPCYAGTVHVPEDFTSIQSAIDAASDGDTVMVGPGHYQENIKIFNKEIHLISIDGPESTILDGNGLDAVIEYYYAPGKPKLEGFKITNGSRGGVQILRAKPVIDHCIISNNSHWSGGGISANRACPVTIRNTEISENTSLSDGGGVASNLGCIQIYSSKIVDNKAMASGGGVASVGFCGGVFVDHSLVEGNSAELYGGAYYASGTNRCPPGVWSHNNLIVNNQAKNGGGVYQGAYGRTSLWNDTISQNVASSGGGFFGTERSWSYSVINSIIYHNSTLPYFPETTYYNSDNKIMSSDIEGGVNPNFCDGTNISADPLFSDTSNGNFSLQSDSPCINNGNTEIDQLDDWATETEMDWDQNLRVHGEGIDMGAFEYSMPLVAADLKLSPSTINLNSKG